MARRRKIGSIEEDALLIGGLVIGGYFLIKNVVPGFFGAPDPAQQQTIQDVSTSSPIENPFSINFKYSLYAQAPNTYNADWFKSLHDIVRDPNNQQSGGVINIALWGEAINNAFGVLWETDNDIESVFNQVTTQADVSNIAAYMLFVWGDDLFTLIKNGRGFIPGVNNGMSGQRLANLINHVNSLPTH